MKKLCVFILSGLVLFTAGCPKSTPQRPEVLEQAAKYEIAQLNNNIATYQCAANGETVIVGDSGISTTSCPTNSVNTAKARRVRNETVYRLIKVTDFNYFQFENDLYVKRATGSFLADALDLGGNLAATITNGERAKTIINAALIAFRGGRKSASIHYFQEQTADALISSMQASRNRVLAEIIERLNTEDIDTYPLDASLGDAIRYFYAGTLPRALQELKAGATRNAQQSEIAVREVKNFKLSPLVTEEEKKLVEDSTAVLVKLFKDVNAADANTRKGATEKLQKIVVKLLEVESLKEILTSQKLSSADTGLQILEKLVNIRSDLRTFQNFAALNKANEIISTIDTVK